MTFRQAYCIVWTPLPIISWLIPLIGHTGISNSEGIIFDFGASFYIAEDNFTFGQPTKYVQLDPDKLTSDQLTWDQAIRQSADRFRQRQHNIATNNCHDHVADTLNAMEYAGRRNYNSFDVFLMVTFKSKYIGIKGFLTQWVPFLLLVSFIIAFTKLTRTYI